MTNDFENVLAFAPLAGLVLTGEAAQVLVSWLKRAGLIYLVSKILQFVIKICEKPAYLGGLFVLVMYFPDTLQWLLMQIGLLELRIFAIILGAVMPDIFTTGAGLITSWSQIFNDGINALPADMVDVMAKMNIAELMGLITSTLTAGWTIRLYFRIINRATSCI